jgi:hypothetical protein
VPEKKKEGEAAPAKTEVVEANPIDFKAKEEAT